MLINTPAHETLLLYALLETLLLLLHRVLFSSFFFFLQNCFKFDRPGIIISEQQSVIKFPSIFPEEMLELGDRKRKKRRKSRDLFYEIGYVSSLVY